MKLLMLKMLILLLIPDEGKYINKYKPFNNNDNDLNHSFKIKHVNSAYYFE